MHEIVTRLFIIRHNLSLVTWPLPKKVKVLSATCEGKKHDKKLADEQAIQFPKGSKVWKDTGFQGYEPEGVTTYQPMKKPKGKELTTEQKQNNKELSRERIGVEHSIGGIKVSRIVHDIFRNFREDFDDLVMETACGLHNWRLDFRLTTWTEPLLQPVQVRETLFPVDSINSLSRWNFPVFWVNFGAWAKTSNLEMPVACTPHTRVVYSNGLSLLKLNLNKSHHLILTRFRV